MGKYLKMAEQSVQKFKTTVEKETDVRLENIVVKDEAYDVYGYGRSDSTISMYVYPGRSTVYVCENSIGRNKDEPESFTQAAAVHELSHIAQYSLVRRKYSTLKAKPVLSLYARWILRRFDKIRAFQEGFANYMCLNHMRDDYDETLKKYACKTENNLNPSNFGRTACYIQGYNFFRKVLNIIGKDELLKVASKPALHEMEVRIPLLYLMRNYPVKGIKNIPKFMYQSIKRRIKK